MSDRIEAWIARLNRLASEPQTKADRAAECVLLGHEPSGEMRPLSKPLHICWWCAKEFRLPDPQDPK